MYTSPVVGVFGRGQGYGPGELGLWQDAMEMPWAKKDELREAIPPAYTEFLGDQLMTSIQTGSGAPKMQTFLPYPNFAASAMVLDRQRLGKQRLECVQILSAISNGGGWRNHPAVRMWHGHSSALRFYHDVVVREWIRRGYVNHMPLLVPPPSDSTLQSLWADGIIMPDWLGDEALHASHRAALLAKDPTHYSQFGWEEEPAVAYIWPTGLVPQR